MKLPILLAIVSILLFPHDASASTATSISSTLTTTTRARSAKTLPVAKRTALLEQVRAGASVPTTRRDALVADLLHRLKVGCYFALWYALNVMYNIVNKRLLNVWPAPVTVGSIQLGIGALYVSLLWLFKLRPRPTLTTPQANKAVQNVGFWHATGQICSMVSLGAGPVSFTHIVKALEPFFSAVVSAIILGQVMPAAVYATLLPVVGGVGYACLKERAFSWLAFGMAMASNVAFALRAVLSKVVMTDLPGMTPANIFGLVTQSSFLWSIPMALVSEGPAMNAKWQIAMELQPNQVELAKTVVWSGLLHYLNNEVMYLALGQVHPITLAVANTMKRVFIMVASVIVFGNEISLQAAIGSAIGIAGVLWYSLAKQSYEKQLQEQNTKRRV